MSCHAIQKELSAYLDGELSSSAREAIDTHLKGCAACQQRLAELHKLAEGLAVLPQVQTDSRYVADVRRRIRQAEAPVAKTRWADLLFQPLWLKIPVEATAVILVLFFVVHMVQPGRQTPLARMAKLESTDRPTATILAQDPTAHAERSSGEATDEKATRALQPTDITARKAPAFAAATPAPAPEAPAEAAADDLRAMADSASPRRESRPLETESAVKAMGKDLVADLGATRPAPTGGWSVTDRLVVRAENPAGVRARAETLAQSMNATLIDASKTGETSSRFLVRLPAGQVAQFKTQLVATADKYKTKENLRTEEVRARGGAGVAGAKIQAQSALAEDRDQPVGELKLGAARADSLAKATAPVIGTNELARQPAKPAGDTVVLEIQVLPPAP